MNMFLLSSSPQSFLFIHALIAMPTGTEPEQEPAAASRGGGAGGGAWGRGALPPGAGQSDAV